MECGVPGMPKRRMIEMANCIACKHITAVSSFFPGG